jgi:hypothetical protein
VLHHDCFPPLGQKYRLEILYDERVHLVRVATVSLLNSRGESHIEYNLLSPDSYMVSRYFPEVVKTLMVNRSDKSATFTTITKKNIADSL